MTNDHDAFTRDGFVKGYTGAMLKDAPFVRTVVPGGLTRLASPTIADLADDTKAAILKDCAARLREYGRSYINGSGAVFWKWRQAGLCANFPPLTPFLDDKSKVRLDLKETR